MKNKNIYTAIAYWFLILGLLMFISGCRTKKSTTDYKQEITENASITDNSTVAKKETFEENSRETKKETIVDKSFFEAWMQIKSDEATFEDKAGNKWTFKNPQVNSKSSQINHINKSDETEIESNKVATSEENKQNDVKTDTSKETKTDLKQSNSSKGKEPFWLYVIIGAVIVICFIYLNKQIFKKSN